MHSNIIIGILVIAVLVLLVNLKYDYLPNSIFYNTQNALAKINSNIAMINEANKKLLAADAINKKFANDLSQYKAIVKNDIATLNTIQQKVIADVNQELATAKANIAVQQQTIAKYTLQLQAQQAAIVTAYTALKYTLRTKFNYDLDTGKIIS